MKFVLIIPTFNAGENFIRLIAGLNFQSIIPEALILIDSGSTDDTLTIARSAGAKIHSIERGTFNHAATRELARSLLKADIYIYMTQDVIPANPYTLENMVRPLIEYSEVGLVYGRQLPQPGAGPIESYGRLFSYPNASQLINKSDRVRLGIKTVFCSNACAAYRRDALDFVGGFPKDIIMCEDIYVAAKMLEAAFSIYYAADALVYHSHNYSILQEFRRYFDIGVFYESQNRWIIETFGGTGKRGAQLFWNGLRHFYNTNNIYLVPEWLIRTIAKLCAYKLGAKEQCLPILLRSHFTMHKEYWHFK
jgi:rhamnosyltransferase